MGTVVGPRMREGLGAAGAALGFSGVQRRWRLEKTEGRLKTPQCAHTGTLEPGGSSVTPFPPL